MRTHVMKSAVIRYDHFTTPPSISRDSINGATLPVKIESARRAIAECTDLAELLRYKSQAEGLAAAVRVMKEVGPKMIRDANCMMADAWRKGGELLSAYSNLRGNKAATLKGVGKGRGCAGGFFPSERGKVCTDLGISQRESAAMVRLSIASEKEAYTAASRRAALVGASKLVPPVNPLKISTHRSVAYNSVMSCEEGNTGIGAALRNLRRVDNSQFQHLTPDERKIVKAKITEITELLDEMDRLCR